MPIIPQEQPTPQRFPPTSKHEYETLAQARDVAASQSIDGHVWYICANEYGFYVKNVFPAYYEEADVVLRFQGGRCLKD